MCRERLSDAQAISYFRQLSGGMNRPNVGMLTLGTSLHWGGASNLKRRGCEDFERHPGGHEPKQDHVYTSHIDDTKD